jgi:hypothetical protein
MNVIQLKHTLACLLEERAPVGIDLPGLFDFGVCPIGTTSHFE